MGAAVRTPLRAHLLKESLYIDAGVGHVRLRVLDEHGQEIENEVLPSNRDFRELCAEKGIAARFGADEHAPIFITGKLSAMVREALGCGHTFFNAAALWLAACDAAAEVYEDNLRPSLLSGKEAGDAGEEMTDSCSAGCGSCSCTPPQTVFTADEGQDEGLPTLAMVEISASGYTLVGIDGAGNLKKDLLVLNPRCGAGTGVNIDRVLQKLGIERSEVDHILAAYLGEAGKAARADITTRADRCGVFGASATISDKNQGIPLAVALATTLKSETLKVCRKLPAGFDRVIMSGRFFNWQFVRDCAEDYLSELGVRRVDYDPENTRVLDAVHQLVQNKGVEALVQTDQTLLRNEGMRAYPAFAALKEHYEAQRLYRRMESANMAVTPQAGLDEIPVHLGLDVGSTMAKVVIADDAGEIVFLDAYSNAGDTIETVKQVFDKLKAAGFSGLQVRSIGITGSARYQVREALSRIYPEMSSRVSVLVENYAHARGSIDHAREHLRALEAEGVPALNRDFCILVDIGGEDTKISVLALQEAELFNNAMNIKCSAGTGSLMDTLSALFGIPGAAEAGRSAMQANQSYEINATCAVFLMENAQKLQAQGIDRGEILASANWAIVENMARTLWSQVELPENAVVLMHGQTMLSDPLPLAVTHRLQDYLDAPAYALVPPYPGHRACIGLIRTMLHTAPEGAQYMAFDAFLNTRFEKRIIRCKGAACDDAEAVCNRTSLKCKGGDGKPFTFTLGGCSAINEVFAKAAERKAGKIAVESTQVRDTYKEIWDFIDQHHPQSEAANRLVIPRSFVVSEWAYFLAEFFGAFDLPVHVDNVIDRDLTAAQPRFDIDSCAPHMGVVGQMLRLVAVPHGMILAPQIEKLPTGATSLGRTCTLNQGGFAVARGVAQTEVEEANIHLFRLDLSELDAAVIADSAYEELQPIFAHYGLAPSRTAVADAFEAALEARARLRATTADLAADMMEEAIAAERHIALVVGREYLLTPGIYDSHVRRLLRDKQMVAIPSYVLDVALNADFGHIYWRNPHLISTILHAVAEKNLHTRIQQPRLAALFAKLEASGDLLPVVQVSTFCCGPDSVTLPLAAELMKKRPFLLIQSDAIIKELAHLENRVNTYVRQLELGLHEKMAIGAEEPFEIRALDELENNHPLNPKEDVIYIPTMADNRVLTSVFRGAGFTCIDNYHEDFHLEGNIKQGRRALGDAVCAPMAGVYADLERAQEDFMRRRAAGDPLFKGKKRLLFFDNAGSGPCRQGQYVEVHKLTAHREGISLAQPTAEESGSCSGGYEAVMRFLIGRESAGYNVGLEEWTLLRLYQGAVLQGVLHDLYMQGAWVCRDAEEFKRFEQDYRTCKENIYAALENYQGPGKLARGAVKLLGTPAKYFAYHLNGSDITPHLKAFARRWLTKQRMPSHQPVSIHITGEVYMRVAMCEDVLKTLLSILGFRRFQLRVAPMWAYLEYLLEEEEHETRECMETLNARALRLNQDNTSDAQQRTAKKHLRNINRLRRALRHFIAAPLYRAAALSMPEPVGEVMVAGREVLPTLRPAGELAPYVGEVLHGLRAGHDLYLNVAPTGCMVSAMGQVFTPKIKAAAQAQGQIQHLFSADGEINDELLSMALLKKLGPQQFFVREAP